MSNFDNKSLKNVTLKSTTTHQCSTLKTVKSNSYLASLSIHNDTTYDKFSNNTYEVYLQSIENEWVYYAIIYGKESFNGQHNRSKKQTLKQHVQKLNELFAFRKII